MIEQILEDNRPLLIALCVALVAAFVAIYNINRIRFHAASDKFRGIILKELEGLYPIPSCWPNNAFYIGKILADKFGIISSAVEDFRHHVPFYNKNRFDRAWFRYYNAYAYELPNTSKNEQSYDHYMAFQDNPDPKETFKANVAALLKFAE